MIAAINMLWKVYPSKLEATGIRWPRRRPDADAGAGFRASPQASPRCGGCLSWSRRERAEPAPLEARSGRHGLRDEMLCGGCALMLCARLGRARRRGCALPFHEKRCSRGPTSCLRLAPRFQRYMVLLGRVSGGLARLHFRNPLSRSASGCGSRRSGHRIRVVLTAVILLGVVLLMARRPG